MLEHAKTLIELLMFLGSGLFYWGSRLQHRGCVKERKATAEMKREIFEAFLSRVQSEKANGRAV